MKKTVLFATAAVLAPAALALAQEDKLPSSATSAPETSLTPQTKPPAAVQNYVEALRTELDTAPKDAASAGEKPRTAGAKGAKGAEKGGAVSIHRELLWEEDLEHFQRRKVLAPKKRLEGGISEVHVVQPGDTLWDLSSRYLNSPWLWPRVWSYNPHITNPHWIYPGQVVRFRPLVASVGTESTEPPLTAAIEKIVPGHQGVTHFVPYGFLSREAVKQAGKLEHSPNDQLMLSRYHTGYVSFAKPQDVKVGDKFLTARLGDEVEHPATGKSMGQLVAYTGELEVTAVGKDNTYFTTTVRQSWRSVERSDLILPWENVRYKTEQRANGVELRGYIVATRNKLLGRHQLAFIDLGSKQGVEVGNRFRVARRGDGYQREEEFEGNLKKMPLEDVGEVVVLSVKPESATGLVTRSLRELEVGDKIEMRKGE